MEFVKLADIADIQTGPFGSQLHQEDYVEQGTPIITVEHLGEYRIGRNNLPLVSDADKQRLNKYIMHEGDIIFSRVGSVDRCSYVTQEEDGWLFSGRCLRVRPNAGMIDPYFLYSALSAPKTKEFIRAIAVGATMPSINTSILGEISIPAISLQEQLKLTAVLSPLDAQNSLNDRIQEICKSLLEETWNSITNNQNQKTIGEVFDLNPRTKMTERSTCRFLDMKSLPDNALVASTWQEKETQNGSKFLNGDVLLARITPCFENGKKGIVDFLLDGEVGVGSTEFIVFRPKPGVPTAAAYCVVSDSDFRSNALQAMVGTSGRQRIQASEVAEFQVNWPNESDLGEFSIFSDRLLSLVTAKRNENLALSKARDELLPLLMNGTISVSEAAEVTASVTK